MFSWGRYKLKMLVFVALIGVWALRRFRIFSRTLNRADPLYPFALSHSGQIFGYSRYCRVVHAQH